MLRLFAQVRWKCHLQPSRSIPAPPPHDAFWAQLEFSGSPTFQSWCSKRRIPSQQTRAPQDSMRCSDYCTSFLDRHSFRSCNTSGTSPQHLSWLVILWNWGCWLCWRRYVPRQLLVSLCCSLVSSVIMSAVRNWPSLLCTQTTCEAVLGTICLIMMSSSFSLLHFFSVTVESSGLWQYESRVSADPLLPSVRVEEVSSVHRLLAFRSLIVKKEGYFSHLCIVDLVGYLWCLHAVQLFSS